jgi:hypothetical protein
MDQNTQSSLRIAGVGSGTFFVVAGFFLVLLIVFGGSFMKRPRTLYLTSVLIYGTLLLYLTTARRRSQDVSKLFQTRLAAWV